MGQYYTLYNIDKKTSINAIAFDGGLKLMETCYVGNPFVNGISELMSGDWRGDRIMYVGDYAWDAAMQLVDGAAVSRSGLNTLADFYKAGVIDSDPYAADDYLDRVGPEAAKELVGRAKCDNPGFRYVGNLDKRVFYDREEMPLAWEFADKETGEVVRVLQDALLLFLAVGNAAGGGDYYSDQAIDQVGSWAGDRIAVLSEPPEGFAKIASPFDPKA